MDEQLVIIRRRGGDRAAKRAAWQHIIACWKSSGLGVTEFCRRHGIPVKRLFKWRARLQQPSQADVGRFVEVQPASRPDDHQRVEIYLGEARVLVPRDLFTSHLAGLFAALKEAAC